MEEMQRSTVQQKDARETEGEGIQNSDQASNAIWGRNVGYNEEKEKRIEVTEMRMLRWMCGVTRKTRSGMNTYEEQQEWRRLPKRSPRED